MFIHSPVLYFLHPRLPPTPTLFPYTTLFRSVGQVAKRQAVTNPQNTVFSIKRFMGRRVSEVVEETKRVPYKVDRKSTRLNSSHTVISYAVFCLKKKKQQNMH